MILYEYDSNDQPSSKLPLRFGSINMLRKYLVAYAPYAIDVGAVFRSANYTDIDKCDNYAHRPNFLSFDVDIKDYSREETCKGHALCDVCWTAYGRPALVNLMHFLTTFMEFKRVIPVFSGGGGFHIHVLDDRVWEWDQDTRDDLNRYIAIHLPSVILDKAIMLSHLIKLPFSPHANGNLSLPILDIHQFLPSIDAIKVKDMSRELISKYLI